MTEASKRMCDCNQGRQPCTCKEPIQYGQLDPQQRLDLARGNPQQPASVGGEREFQAAADEAFREWEKDGNRIPAPNAYMTARDGFRAGAEWQARAALSPAGGGVVMPERKKPWYCMGEQPLSDEDKAYNAALDDVTSLNAKPQTYGKYTTQPGEAVAGIALRQLKDESRWVEIRDLNAHAFPDIGPHDYYPVGTVLTMPAKPQANSQKGSK